jgi:glucosyl-dolichyl phosphate glucuronosyltransferase
MSLDVSVIVCTHDRPARLRSLLESATRLVVPSGLAWEMLVIDNAFEARSSDVVRPFTRLLPVRVVREPRIGICFARNRGVAEARGRYVCWTDDDALLEPLWLSAYVEAFRRHPEAAVFGGRVLPVLEPPVSPLFARSMHRWPLANVVGHRDFGDEESRISLEGGRIPWGTSYAVRTREQKQHPYNLELGLAPGRKRMGEETDVIYRILKAGGSGWWVPGARSHHMIPAERQTLSFFDAYYEQAGRTAAFVHDRFPGDNANAVHGRPDFAEMSGFTLRCVAAAARLVSVAAGLAGLRDLALRFRARRFYFLGVAADRRDRYRLEGGTSAAGVPNVGEAA